MEWVDNAQARSGYHYYPGILSAVIPGSASVSPRGLGFLSSNLVPERNQHVISVELVTRLLPSCGCDAVVDRLSKTIRVMHSNSEISSKGLSRLFRDRVWRTLVYRSALSAIAAPNSLPILFARALITSLARRCRLLFPLSAHSRNPRISTCMC